jgi:sugar lactone lactonase YvrE
MARHYAIARPTGYGPQMERVASGYVLAEAPVAAPGGGVYFSDVLGGGVHHWSPQTGDVDTVVEKRRGVGGMALHADGGLVMSGRDVIHVRDGESRTLFAPPDGVTGMNDLTVGPDGHVIVGLLRFRPFAGETPVDGEFVTLAGGVVLPGVLWTNGCAFSPDGTTFYGCDYERGLVLAADRDADGAYGAPRTVVVSPSGDADGMAVDEDGCLWVALGSRPSVGRFTPAGELDSEIAVDAEFVASVAFTGSDRRDLVITTTGDVFVTPVAVAGLAVPAARD